MHNTLRNVRCATYVAYLPFVGARLGERIMIWQCFVFFEARNQSPASSAADWRNWEHAEQPQFDTANHSSG